MESIRPDRRWLIAAGAACFAGMSPAALAQDIRRARASGRPLLTSDALNRVITASSARGNRQFLLSIANDIRGFVRTNFTLTARQETELAHIADAELANLSAMLRRAAANGEDVRVEIGVRAAASGRGGAADSQTKGSTVTRLSAGRVVESSTLDLEAPLRPPAYEFRARKAD